VWQELDHGYRSIPVSGLAYYISPPSNMHDIMRDPIHLITYMSFIMLSCAYFSKLWIEISGDTPRDRVKQLRQSDMAIVGYRDKSMISVLQKNIPVAAMLGGMSVGFLSILADFLGAIGSGSGILLAVNIIYGYFEKIHKEKNNLAYNIVE
jgi:protein transport protein SEC61 subunit alpha